jgi:transcriptional regulator with XRE-family HTH domain
MTIYKTIREQLGLSQQDLAGLFATKRSQLSYAETGDRFISAQGAHTLAALIPLVQAATVSPVTLPPPGESARKEAERRAKICYLKLYPLEHQAALMRRKYEQAILRQRALLPLLDNPLLTPKQKNWCEILLDTATLMIRKNDPGKQWLLQMEMEAIKKEMEIYRAHA